MRLAWKNRCWHFIVLSIYLNTGFEFILPTNGNISAEAGVLTQQHHNNSRRVEHLLLLGTYSSNKARSPLIKSIVSSGSNTKHANVVRVEGLPEKVINGVASPEYHSDNRKNIKKANNSRLKILIPWNGLYDKDSFGRIRRRIQNKLLFAVTSKSGARGNDLSFADSNQGKPNNHSSSDIGHIGYDSSSGWDKTSTGGQYNALSFKVSHKKPYSTVENISQTKAIKKTSYWKGIAKIVPGFSLKTKNIAHRRFKRNEQKYSQNVTVYKAGISENDSEVDTGRLPTGYDLYNELLKYMNHYLNMSTDSENFTTNTAPWVIEVHCPDVIKDLYRTVKAPDDGQLYCNSSWDEFSCWPRTLAGTYSVIPCPGYLPGIDASDNATKYCHENGTWADKASYVNCLGETEVIQEEDVNTKAIRYIYHIGFSLSTLTLVIALFIFLYFRSLRCLRNSIHCHLIVSFIFMNIMWIIMRHTLIPVTSSQNLQWLMKFEVALYNYSQGTNFFWMFVEGLYLHIIIVWTYSADKIKLRYLFVIGWILPALVIIAWILVMETHSSASSWLPESMEDNGSNYIHITPILLVLFANIIFLSTIVWVLITKLRASHTLETRQYRKAVKATIILFPLLGITYVLFIVPPSNDPQVHVIFNYINAILQSLQGFFVAVFYCFLNGEVKGVLKKRVLRFNDARSLSSKYTKTSVAWTRASRDYTNTATYGNGTVSIQNRRYNGQQAEPEQIPLQSKEGYETEECMD